MREGREEGRERRGESGLDLSACCCCCGCTSNVLNKGDCPSPHWIPWDGTTAKVWMDGVMVSINVLPDFFSS